MHQKNTQALSRRDFIKLAAVSLGGLAFQPFTRGILLDFPAGEKLGRITVGKMDLKSQPDANSSTVGVLYADAIVPWLREHQGLATGRINQRWVETPDGFLWGGHVQPVRNQPNIPVTSLPQTSLGKGMWAEVTVPYVDLFLENPPARAPWLQYQVSVNLPPRFYDSQVVWVDQIQTDENGKTLYRLNEKFGYGDIFWADAEAFKPFNAEDVAPIAPDVEEKKIVVNIHRQEMSCFEEDVEVFFARVSTGALFDAWGNKVDAWSTPIGEHRIWRKSISLPLSGGSADAGWALPAVGFVSLFVGSGVAFHSTYWHNNYGEPSSRGCVNVTPEDAKWIYRWTLPQVLYDPGDITVEWPGGTLIEVVES
jgi:hypothetical protein